MLPERRKARSVLAVATAAANRNGRDPRTDPAVIEARRRYAIAATTEFIDSLTSLTPAERARLFDALPAGDAR